MLFRSICDVVDDQRNDLSGWRSHGDGCLGLANKGKVCAVAVRRKGYKGRNVKKRGFKALAEFKIGVAGRTIALCDHVRK